jgi:RNA polymerase sigma factor (sigma-70 family)
MITEDTVAFVQKLRQGDEVSWKKLIDNYKDKVFKTALSFVPFADDAEDLAQEVFVEVYKSISGFRGNSSLSTWIYRITVNKAINYLKKNRKYLNARPIDDYIAVEKEMASDSQDASFSVQQKEHRKIIMQAIQKLPERQATVFVMHKINGKPYKEISELLDISLSSVESLMHRARISLQDKLISLYKQYQK